MRRLAPPALAGGVVHSVLALALAIIATRAHAASSESGYRLAGVLKSGEDASIAILELPRGGQVLIHKGSLVDGGTVVELSRRRVRIAFPDRVIELVLDGRQGGSTETASSLGAEKPSGVDPAPARSPRFATTLQHPAAPRPLSPESVRRFVSAGTVRTLLINGIARVPHDEDSKAYLDAQLTQALDLPPQSKVVSVNDMPVGSAQQTVDSLQRAFANGIAVLGLATPQGPQRIYAIQQP